MNQLNILHVSDLHYEETSKAKHIQIAEALIADLKRIESKENISPDLVLFSGDLVNRGSDGTEAYKGVSTIYVEPLLSALGLTQEQFFSVPGNHDVDRSRCFIEFENGLGGELNDSESLNQYYGECLRDHHRYAPLRPKLSAYSEFEKSYDGDTLCYRDDFMTADILEFRGIKIGIARVNSAWRSSGFGTDQGRLLVGSDVLDKLASFLGDVDLRIAMAHHPLSWLTGWNEREVQNRLAKNFNLYFCGHLHNSNGILFNQILGGVYISEAGCLRSGRLSNYSVVTVDLDADNVTTRFRRWYPDREEFDQETEKAPDGIARFEGIKLQGIRVKERLWFADLRAKLREQLRADKVVNPLEGVVDLDVDDVFIEPFIRDASVHNREVDKPETFGFEALVDKPVNIIFYGGKEAGKSTLLLRLNELALRAEPNSDHVKIPIRIRFKDFSKHNINGFIKSLRRATGDQIDQSSLKKLLQAGLVVLLVDDLGDHNDVDRNRKLEVFNEFILEFQDVRVIATILENVRPFPCERLDLIKSSINASTYYLWPFTAARLRQLLEKISLRKEKAVGAAVDVERLLDQIIYYFKNLQIPITPLAATLFIGVLFRDIKQKDIQNEAYLIENYSRDLLEKLGADTIRPGDLEYPEKVAFLSHIASRMHELIDYEWSIEAFRDEASDYFRVWGEDVPRKEIIDQFFEKGILDIYAGKISFKFKFWFNFFLAKAMTRNVEVSKRVMGRKDYLSFRTAISYKAGLLRNDVELVEEITQRLLAAGTKFGKGDKPFEGILDLSGQVAEVTPLLEGEIRQKNSAKEVDNVKQEDLTGIIISDQEEESEDDVVDLLTLHSELIKHTRELREERKIELVRLNVQGYIGLMYIFNEAFMELVEKMNLKELARFMFPKEKTNTGERRLNSMLRQGRRMIWRVVPTSVALYIADHLATSRMAGTFIAASKAKDAMEFESAIHLMMAFRADFGKGLSELERAVQAGLEPMSEFVIQAFVQIVVQESRLSDEQIDRVVALLSSISVKYVGRGGSKKIEGPTSPNVRDQIKKQLRLNSEDK